MGGIHLKTYLAANNTAARVAPNQYLKIKTLPTSAARNVMPQNQATSAQFTALKKDQSICTRYPNLRTSLLPPHHSQKTGTNKTS